MKFPKEAFDTIARSVPNMDDFEFFTLIAKMALSIAKPENERLSERVSSYMKIFEAQHVTDAGERVFALQLAMVFVAELKAVGFIDLKIEGDL